jgi:hypothetical protein
MSTDSLGGIVGQPAHFAGDYLFRDTALPNNATIHSEGHTLNNTLGRLQLTGTIDQSLTLTSGNTLTIVLQYKDDNDWKTLKTLVSASSGTTLTAGEVFVTIPVPSNTRRIHRLQIMSNFDASAVKLTAAVEILPLG